jgi:hypothetical protein
MLPHCWEGTQRLELPVSRTTLKLWGGVPMVISEKSGQGQLGMKSIEFNDTYTGRS